ncbi:MAG: type IV secretion system protein [Legionellales bacterium]|nr:type IV secretion system protein [Legionellales bacterium]
MMSFTLFSELFQQFDRLTSTFVTDVSSNAISTILPIVTAGMTLSFVIYGLLIMNGVINMPLLDFCLKSLRIGIIVSIATTGGLYQTQWASQIQTLPDTLATSLLSGHVNVSSAELIDEAATEGFNQAADAFSKAGMFSKQGIVYAIFALLFLIGTVVITTVGGVFIILSKVALCVLAALGPLFIFALLFKSTERLFESWLSQILSYGLLVILLSAVFGFMLHLFSGYVASIHLDGQINLAESIGGCLILSLATVIILLQLPQMAASLSHGVTLDTRGVTGSLGRGAAAGTRAVGRGIINKVKRDFSGR